jgi:type II secretory pathway component GspD/PulD (secretin)
MLGWWMLGWWMLGWWMLGLTARAQESTPESGTPPANAGEAVVTAEPSTTDDPSNPMQPPGDGAPGDGAPPGSPPNGSPPNGSPTDPNAANVGKGPQKTPEVPTIKRGTTPDEPPDKREFDIRPDEDGMVQFQFRNQAWPDILKWLATVSNMTLDWQELPADFLNISTQRKFTLEETRDVVNRHLLARGFTMLEFGNTLLVTKTAGINVSLVPKVDPVALVSLPPNRFVRISIPLRSLIANDILAELKVLISSNGTLNALSSTNRLEAMDSVSNLRELLVVLQDEQSAETLDNLAREFELQYVRASDAREQLAGFLKLETKKQEPMVMSEDMDMMQQQMMMQQQQQQMMMMQQQQQQQQPGQAKKGKTEVLLIANVRRNSLIVHAPPDQMAIITSFVKRIDVPSKSDDLGGLNTRMKVYRLAALDPKKLVASLLALDALEPTTKLEIDEKNKAIIAYASLADQWVIQQTLERLDGSARQFDVIQLRRLRAEDVAGTIRTLLGIDKEKKESNTRRSYFFYDPFGSGNKKETPDDQLRVGANVQNNQLLIWANELEREEIHKLLTKLGEAPTRPQDRTRTRVIEANRSRDTLEYLRKLEGIWGRDSETPLILPDESSFDPSDSTPGSIDPTDEDLPTLPQPNPPIRSSNDISDAPPADRGESLPPSTLVRAILPQDDTNQPQPAKTDQAAITDAAGRRSGPPVRIRFDVDGNLVLESDDLEALDRLEQLMTDRAPPSRKHVVFSIRHARPSWIKLNLEDYFKDDKKEKKNDGRDLFYSYIFDLEHPEKDDDSPQLGRRRKLRFISDNDTKSLLVIGADSTQQETIARLIKLWDVPPPEDKRSLRFTNVVKVEHSRADSIVEAIKDAFRDLLSSNDKALEKPSPDANKEKKREDSDGEVGSGGGMSFTFSGRLSLGVDRVTNSVIVSAKGEDLLDLVCKLIHDLDEAAKPTGTVQSIQLNGANPSAIEKALKNIIRNDQKQPRDVRLPGQGQESGNGNPLAPNQGITPYNGRNLQNDPNNENDR